MQSSDVTLGLALDFGPPKGKSIRDVAEGLQPVVDLAESSGFDSLWAGEMYSQRSDAWAAPSALSVLSWLASRTTRVRLGTGVLLAPAWHPLRLAYEAAAVDQLSGGRLVVGVGAGNRALSDWFSNEAPTARVMDELLDAVTSLWRGSGSYRHGGVTRDGALWPPPVQPGGPSVLVGGLADAAARRAAAHDGWYGATNHLLSAHLRPAIDRYRRARDSGEDSRPEVVAVNRMAYVAPSVEVAQREGRRYARQLMSRYADYGALVGPDNKPVTMESGDIDRLVDELAIIGSPDQVQEKLEVYRAAGVTHVQLRVAFSQIPVDAVMRSVELLASLLPQRAPSPGPEEGLEAFRTGPAVRIEGR